MKIFRFLPERIEDMLTNCVKKVFLINFFALNFPLYTIIVHSKYLMWSRQQHFPQDEVLKTFPPIALFEGK